MPTWDNGTFVFMILLDCYVLMTETCHRMNTIPRTNLKRMVDQFLEVVNCLCALKIDCCFDYDLYSVFAQVQHWMLHLPKSWNCETMRKYISSYSALTCSWSLKSTDSSNNSICDWNWSNCDHVASIFDFRSCVMGIVCMPSDASVVCALVQIVFNWSLRIFSSLSLFASIVNGMLT